MTVTAMLFALVIIFGGIMLVLGLGFLGAALQRNHGRAEQAEQTKAMLQGVRAGHS